MGTIDFDHLIDASGRNGIMATRYLKNREFHEVFKNVAIWGYWEDVAPPPEIREGAIAVGSIPDGWIWAIPLSDGQTSLGVVMHHDEFRRAKQESSLKEVYEDAITASPLIKRMTAIGRLVTELKVEQDYSYSSDKFAGPGYLLAGDAACFLDPLLSIGVHLAMYSGMLAAASLASVVRDEIAESKALAYYDHSYRHAYLRLLIFGQAFYEARGKLGCFSQAEQLSHYTVNPDDIRRAFLNLVSGLEDIADAEQTTWHLMGEMTRRIDETEEHACLSSETAIDGLYVKTTPRLGLAHAVRSARLATPVEATSI